MTPDNSTYGTIAVVAALKAASGLDARLAWESTAHIVLAHSPTSARKSCPKVAFLGLVHAGEVTGVPGVSCKPKRVNGRYALVALDLLRRASSNGSNPTELWREVMEIEGAHKKHNSQMHVVTALWNEGLFVGQGA